LIMWLLIAKDLLDKVAARQNAPANFGHVD
jgi:hypothetical protein